MKPKSPPVPHATKLEYVARHLAAAKMNLTDDLLGEHLPGDLWRQALPEAARLLDKAAIVLWELASESDPMMHLAFCLSDEHRNRTPSQENAERVKSVV
jgi:hypothetical protein